MTRAVWLSGLTAFVLAGAVIAGAQRSDDGAHDTSAPYLVVLGVAQDAGYPQAGSPETAAWHDPSLRRLATSLGLVDPSAGRRWMFEATPDFPDQLHRLDDLAPADGAPGLDGILLTHGHMGHYSGLLHLGPEAIGARGVSIFAMPRMRRFLSENDPWRFLVTNGTLELEPLAHGERTALSERIAVTPLLVPHRDELTETVAFVIHGPARSVLFLPDIDKWERWDEEGTRIEDVVRTVDLALVDGTFFADGEVPGRSMAEIQHPFVQESLDRFEPLPIEERAKVRFIHLNRTNPLVWDDPEALRRVSAAGLGVVREGERIAL